MNWEFSATVTMINYKPKEEHGGIAKKKRKKNPLTRKKEYTLFNSATSNKIKFQNKQSKTNTIWEITLCLKRQRRKIPK